MPAFLSLTWWPHLNRSKGHHSLDFAGGSYNSYTSGNPYSPHGYTERKEKMAKSRYRRNRSGHKARKRYQVSLLYLLSKHCEVADGVLFRVLDVENLRLEVLFIGGVACE